MAIRDVWRPAQRVKPRRHLDETIRWLFRAHDATGRQGVSRSFSLLPHRRYSCTGWLPAYPETTGYIIPTLYEAASILDLPEAAERAEQMAHWETEVQLPDGAVQGGTVQDPPNPAVFNTGQALFGWVRALRETGEPGFQRAAEKATAFLIEAQDTDGAWRRGASRFVRKSERVYNARTGWALCMYGKMAGDSKALDAARRAARFAVANQLPNGWYAENCLNDSERPLTHTIAYAAQGVLEIGLLLGEESFVDSARRTARGVLSALRADGLLPGRLDRSFRPAVSWSCLTGAAQMVLIWDRLAALDEDPILQEAADRALEKVLWCQNVTSASPGIRGGVAGSYPVWGDYGRYEFLNWAAKFLVDALLGRIGKKPSGTEG